LFCLFFKLTIFLILGKKKKMVNAFHLIIHEVSLKSFLFSTTNSRVIFEWLMKSLQSGNFFSFLFFFFSRLNFHTLFFLEQCEFETSQPIIQEVSLMKKTRAFFFLLQTRIIFEWLMKSLQRGNSFLFFLFLFFRD